MGWTVWVKRDEIKVQGETYHFRDDLKAAGFRFRKVGFTPEWWMPTPKEPEAVLNLVNNASKNVPEGFRISLIIAEREMILTRKDGKLWAARMEQGRPVPVKEVTHA